MESEFKISGGNLYYEKSDGAGGGGTVCITGFQGLTGEIEIPERIEGCPVTCIAKKAFLSRKSLRKVTIPMSVTEVGDWAFAYCDNLHTVIFGASGGRKDSGLTECSDSSVTRYAPRFGRAVFMECKNLRFLYIDGRVDNNGKAVAALLAAAVTMAETPYLLNAEDAGSREWLEKWDAGMLSVLHSDDNEGYSKQVLCGEEDYGSTDLDAYESGRRKVKIRLILLRLLYSHGLSLEHRREMEEYLKGHTKGREHEEAWEVVLSEYGEDRDYYGLFADIGCVNEHNLEGILTDIGGEHPEMKAFFLRFGAQEQECGSFFNTLEL